VHILSCGFAGWVNSPVETPTKCSCPELRRPLLLPLPCATNDVFFTVCGLVSPAVAWSITQGWRVRLAPLGWLHGSCFRRTGSATVRMTRARQRSGLSPGHWLSGMDGMDGGNEGRTEWIERQPPLGYFTTWEALDANGSSYTTAQAPNRTLKPWELGEAWAFSGTRANVRSGLGR
jgi:hypothetical protein